MYNQRYELDRVKLFKSCFKDLDASSFVPYPYNYRFSDTLTCNENKRVKDVVSCQNWFSGYLCLSVSHYNLDLSSLYIGKIFTSANLTV